MKIELVGLIELVQFRIDAPPKQRCNKFRHISPSYIKYCQNKELCEYHKRAFAWERAVDYEAVCRTGLRKVVSMARLSDGMAESRKETIRIQEMRGEERNRADH